MGKTVVSNRLYNHYQIQMANGIDFILKVRSAGNSIFGPIKFVFTNVCNKEYKSGSC